MGNKIYFTLQPPLKPLGLLELSASGYSWPQPLNRSSCPSLPQVTLLTQDGPCFQSSGDETLCIPVSSPRSPVSGDSDNSSREGGANSRT